MTAERMEASNVERAMASTPMLAAVAPRAVRDLCVQGTVRHYRRGTYLFYQGDDSDLDPPAHEEEHEV